MKKGQSSGILVTYMYVTQVNLKDWKLGTESWLLGWLLVNKYPVSMLKSNENKKVGDWGRVFLNFH